MRERLQRGYRCRRFRAAILLVAITFATGGYACFAMVRGGGSGFRLMALDHRAGAAAPAGQAAHLQTAQPAQSAPAPATRQIKSQSKVQPKPGVTQAASTPAPQRTKTDGPRYNGRRLVKVKTMNMLVTAYSPGVKSCGKWADGKTASGYSVWTNGMKLVAADTRLLPFGTIVSIPGYNGGKPVPVLDRGGKIKGHHLDVLYPSNHRALQWGAQHLHVTVWKYAD